jgi:hypothetical protein
MKEEERVMTMMQQAAARTSERQAFHDQNVGFKNAVLWERSHASLIARPTTHHRNFQRYLKTFGLITMVGVSANLALPMGQAQARGDFSLTCRYIQLNAVDRSKTAMLSAECTRQNPYQTLRSSLNLNDYLTNNHGLEWRRRPGGADFQESCQRTALWPSNHELATVCDHALGTQRKDLNERITNIDGKLKYTGGDEKVIFDTGLPKVTPPIVQPSLKAGPRRQAAKVMAVLADASRIGAADANCKRKFHAVSRLFA